jgi:hypothetical protein
MFDRDKFIEQRKELERFQQQNQRAGETRSVEFLLRQLKLSKQKRSLQALAEARTGYRFLTLDLFAEKWPSFPILMSYSQEAGNGLHEHKKATLPALFTRFSFAPFIKFYEEWFEQAERLANNRTIGLVFPRKGIRRGLILHNGGLDGVWFRGTVCTYTAGTREHPSKLYLQAFAPLIEAIYANGHGWKPDKDYDG